MAEKEEKVSEKKKVALPSKKLMIIIGAAVVGLIVVIVAIVMLTGGSSHDGKAPEAAAGKAAAKSEKGGKGEGGATAASYALEPFIVNIYDGQELRYLKLKVEFEPTIADAKGVLDPLQAPMRDAIIVLLSTKTLQDIQDLQGKNQLRQEIFNAVTKIAPNKIAKVFFTEFVVQ